MNFASIAIFAIVIVLFAGAVKYLRRHGQCAACSGEECGCGSCPHAGKCHGKCNCSTSPKK